MTHPITKHPDGCACSRCDLTLVGEPFPLPSEPTRKDVELRARLEGVPFVVTGPAEVCPSCTAQGHTCNGERLSAHHRAEAFRLAVQGAAELYGVVLEPIMSKASPSFPDVYTIDFKGTVVP